MFIFTLNRTFSYVSNTNFDVDIEDIVYKMTTSASISTFIKWKTNYDVDIDDSILHKMTISTSISTDTDKLQNQVCCPYRRYRTQNDDITIDIDTDKFQRSAHMQIDIDTISSISTFSTNSFSCEHRRNKIDTISSILTPR